MSKLEPEVELGNLVWVPRTGKPQVAMLGIVTLLVIAWGHASHNYLFITWYRLCTDNQKGH